MVASLSKGTGMRSLDEVVEDMELACSVNHHYNAEYSDVLHYLKQYRDIRSILPEKHISYWGSLPVVQIGDRFFAVRNYVPAHHAWRCDRVEWSETNDWFCPDDDNYIIDNKGKIICREVGWDLREVYD